MDGGFHPADGLVAVWVGPVDKQKTDWHIRWFSAWVCGYCR